ncbi:hypothetical protein Patl1_23758 [Pistacia atlantica]|uniref:Uncharacterized protein n=1 Tax=Pistacia atlantica TaxID=434234 RepID=A0ACC1A2P2_9ROSI|nr:hypothetical protein Patl1_23758 [Pistacia atlantica]
MSTPEVLERVYTIESEILQIEEAIAIQSNNEIGLSTVEEIPTKPVESIKVASLLSAVLQPFANAVCKCDAVLPATTIKATDVYIQGAWDFVKMAEKNAGYEAKNLCPCKDCHNLTDHGVDIVYEHLIIRGMDPTYTIWFHHGEIEDITEIVSQVNNSDAFNLITSAYMGANHYASTSEERRDNDFTQSLEDAETPLYPGCAKYTKMSAIVALYKHKVMNGWTDNSFDGLLEMLGDMLPEHNVILKSVYSVSFLTSICEDGETLKWLANGLRNHAMSYNGYVINGQRFHTKDVDKSTQNNGVSIEATTICRASAKDTSQVVDVVTYYGVIKEIILLDYYQFQLPIFKCHWANAGHGVKFEDGFTLVNLHQSQNQYAPPRGYYEFEMYNEDEDLTSRPEYVTTHNMNIYDDSEEVSYVREDCEGVLV